jgi:hypothetical protein
MEASPDMSSTVGIKRQRDPTENVVVHAIVPKRPRHTTSAIPGTNIPEVRRSLKRLRRYREEALPTQPLWLTDMLTPHDTLERFALQFVLGHHMKRSHRMKSTTKQHKHIESCVQDVAQKLRMDGPTDVTSLVSESDEDVDDGDSDNGDSDNGDSDDDDAIDVNDSERQ